MSTTLYLKRCVSEKIHLTKEFVSDTTLTLEGDFRSSIDVLNPVIQIESASDLSLYNYVEIPIFNRKYFCSCKALYEDIWEISAHVDVLGTYADQIKQCKAFVQRTNKKEKINYYMNDGSFYPEQRTVTTYHTFKDGGAITSLKNWQYYLIVAGK